MKCDKCNYECKQKEALKRHKEVEHEGKRFNCNECEHSFLSSSAVEGHKQRVHRQVLHRCDLCDYTNSRRSILKEHVESKHRNIRHPCDECPYTGVSKAWLELIVFYILAVSIICVVCWFSLNICTIAKKCMHWSGGNSFLHLFLPVSVFFPLFRYSSFKEIVWPFNPRVKNLFSLFSRGVILPLKIPILIQGRVEEAQA